MNSSALEDSAYANEWQDYILKRGDLASSSCLELSTEDTCRTCPFTANLSPFPGLQPSPSVYSLLRGLSAYLSSHIHCKHSDLSPNTSAIPSSVIMSYPASSKPFGSLHFALRTKSKEPNTDTQQEALHRLLAPPSHLATLFPMIFMFRSYWLFLQCSKYTMYYLIPDFRIYNIFSCPFSASFRSHCIPCLFHLQDLKSSVLT